MYHGLLAFYLPRPARRMTYTYATHYHANTKIYRRKIKWTTLVIKICHKHNLQIKFELYESY